MVTLLVTLAWIVTREPLCSLPKARVNVTSKTTRPKGTSPTRYWKLASTSPARLSDKREPVPNVTERWGQRHQQVCQTRENQSDTLLKVRVNVTGKVVRQEGTSPPRYWKLESTSPARLSDKREPVPHVTESGGQRHQQGCQKREPVPHVTESLCQD